MHSALNGNTTNNTNIATIPGVSHMNMNNNGIIHHPNVNLNVNVNLTTTPSTPVAAPSSSVLA